MMIQHTWGLIHKHGMIKDTIFELKIIQQTNQLTKLYTKQKIYHIATSNSVAKGAK